MIPGLFFWNGSKSFTHEMTAGASSPYAGFSNNTYNPLGVSFGSIDPASLNGAILSGVYIDTNNDRLWVTTDGLRAQSFFDRIVVDALGLDLLTTNAGHAQNSSGTFDYTYWFWDSITSTFVDGNTYGILFE